MEKTKEKLFSFIENKAFEENKSIEYIIRQYGFENIFSDICNSEKIIRAIKEQEEKNLIFLEEIKQIVRVFPEIVLLKGIWYYSRYYEKQEYRFFKDIDLFIKNADIVTLDRNMKELGYFRLDDNEPLSDDFYYISDTYDDKELSIDKYNHYVYKKRNNALLTVEIHTYLQSVYRYPLIDDFYCYENKKRVLINNEIPIYVLSLEDDLIFNMCHTCKHISYVLNTLEEEKNIEWYPFAGKRLYDLACIMDDNLVDWELALKNASEWDVLQDMLLSCRMIQFFIPNLIPCEIMTRLEKAVKKDKERCLYKSLLRDLAITDDISVVFDHRIFDTVNKNQINYSFHYSVYHRKDLLHNKTLKKSKYCEALTEWDEKYWYIFLKPYLLEKHAVFYISINSKICDIHSLAFFAELGEEIVITSRNMKFKNEEPKAWLQAMEIYITLDNQIEFRINWDMLNINIQEDVIACQLGIIIFNNGKFEDRITLFGRNHYRFYDMGVLFLKK